jgi:3-methylcrotonyl-CoA carboxylase alpha subunit
VFEKVLVANRGEIALRVFRTCRQMGIRTVAVYSDADRGALHARDADERVRIGPASPAESYLSSTAIIEAARASGADAIHPGYGFLAESPQFAEACASAGIVFIGPSPDAMRAMGDKSSARRLAVANDVPVLPGSEEQEHSDDALCVRAEAIGFPVMVKAVGGGGGRGMRLARERGELPEALAAARREAMAAFGDDRLLLERAVVGGRHIEVQVLADAHGAAVHLGERDCSIQRRFQKVIEESPSPAVDAALRRELGEAALRIVRAAGYENAGTVEFLFDADGTYYFLEMNTRLQVEHGVTELTSGRDLVALQLRIASGEPLGFTQDDVRLSGHAIECRLYAEDPVRGYLPSAGRLTYFAPPEGAGIRNDAGVESGSAVAAEYDPLIAKLLIHASSREKAVERCRRALAAYAVDGVQTNLGLLAAVMAHPAFVSGAADLTTLATLPEADLAPRLPDDVLCAAAAADLLPRANEVGTDAWAAVGAWRSDGAVALSYGYHGGAFAVTGQRLIGRERAWRLSIDHREHEVEATMEGPGAIAVTANGVRRRWTVARRGPRVVLESPDGGRYTLSYGERAAGGGRSAAAVSGSSLLRAPMPGSIVQVLVEEGDRVRARQPLVVLEAMKMEHVIEAPADAAVKRVACREGDTVAEGDLLVELAIGDEEGDAAA